MTYGTIKVDTVTFTDAGVDKSVTLSGLVQNPVFSGNVTVTGTLSGVTVTGTTANFTSGNFTNISGGTHTIASGVFAAGSAASPSITFTGDLNTGIYSPGADQVAISTGGSGRLFINSNGDVGVGTGGTQGTKLHAVGGNVWSGNFYEVGRFQKSSGTAISLGYDNSDYVATVGAYSHDGTPSNLSFWTYPGSGTIQERLRITSAGLVGVGTSSPMNLFHVSGTASTPALFERTSTTGSFIGLKDSTSYAYIGNTNGVFSIQTPGSSYSDKLVVTSAGLVGVGTSSPTQFLSIGGSGATLAGTAAISLFDGNSGASRRWSISNGAGGNAIDLLGKLVIGYSSTVSSDPMTGTAAVVIDSSGRVGIGTSSPQTQLHVNGGYDGSVTNRLTFSTTFDGNANSGSGIYFKNYYNNARITAFSNPASGQGGTLQLQTYNSDVSLNTGIVLDNAGRVGIGTTAPATNLEVRGGGAGVDAEARISSNQNGAFVSFAPAGSNTIRQYTIGSAVGGSLIFYDNTASTQRAAIDSSGRLLVGTSTYDGNGIAVFQGNTSSSTGAGAIDIRLGTTRPTAADTPIGYLRFISTSQTSSNNQYANIAAFSDGASTSDGDIPGRLVFSTTADGASSPTEKMRISQNGLVTISGPGGGTFLNLSNSGGYSGLHEVDNTAYTIGQNSDLRAMRIGSGANWLTTGVNLAPGGTSWGTYSDERLKTDIVELTDCLDNIKGIRCISYRLTDVDDANSKKRIGVIAQDLVGKYDEAINASRRSENDETEYLSVQYSDLIPVLLKALQEASVKIESLEARLTAAGI